MRLTLRTMLAYLDDILEPADYKDIGKKIEESEFATSLVHRMRDVTRRLRLGAPKVVGKGMGFDANTVAEYLDNTLSAERVPDFEKVCLESEVHLAEVASCHQILTIVLGEPAEVDPESRRKMYALVHREHATGATPPALPAVPESRVAPVIRERPTVPDYLREPAKSRFWAIAATLLLIVLIGGGVAYGLFPDDVSRILGLAPPEEKKQNDKPAHENGDDEGNKRDTVPNPDDGPRPPIPLDNDEPTPKVDPDAVPFDPTIDDSTKKPTDGDDAADPGRGKLPPLPATVIDPATSVPAKTPASGDTHETAARLGRFVSDADEVLLKFDAESKGWTRIAPKATLDAGDRLLVLPAFQPLISLTAGVTLQPMDDTLLEFENPDNEGVPVVRVHYGRLAVLTAGKPQTKIRLRLGDRAGLVTFGESDSFIVTEVRRYLPYGADPEAQAAGVAVDMYVIGEGEVTWNPADGVVETLKGPKRLVIAEHPGATSKTTFPPWLTSRVKDRLSSGDSLARVDIAKALDDKAPVTQRLRELSDRTARRYELRSLAARSLALIGEFDPFVELFNTPEQRGSWPLHILTLQVSLGRGPDVARKVREDFRKLRGEDGDKLYRMLWGFNKTDVEGGWGTTLVDYLDHESLDFRVLAFHNLKQLSGGISHNYDPLAKAPQRDRAIKSWRDRVNKGQLLPKPRETEPTPDKPAPDKPVTDKPVTDKPADAAVDKPADPETPAERGGPAKKPVVEEPVLPR